MARAVGLDIGTRTIKVVELSGSPKSLKIQRMVIREIPPPEEPAEGELGRDPDEIISDIVRGIFDEFRLPKDDVCAAFDSGATVFREIVVPFFEEDQIRKVVKFEAENHLHSHAIDDVIVNWVKTGESRDGSRLTIFASPKAELARLIGIMRRAGVEPSSVDLDATAVYSACQASGVFTDHPNTILIDVGARSTSLLLVADGRPVVLRSFLLGSDLVERRVSKDLDVSLAEGRRRARLDTGPRADDLMVPASSLEPPSSEREKTLAQIEDDSVDDQRDEFVRKLHRESMRSLASIQDDAAPENILLLGGGSLQPGLDKALQERFGLQVERLDLPARLEWKDRGEDPAFTMASTPAAVGCGLRMMGHNPLGVELLKEDFAPTNLFDVIRTALATAVTLLFVALLILAFVTKQRRDAEKARYTHMAGRAQDIYNDAQMAYHRKYRDQTEPLAEESVRRALRSMPTGPGRAKQMHRTLRNQYVSLERELGLARDIPELRSSLEVWLEIIRALHKLDRSEYGDYFRITEMNITPRYAVLKVEVDDQTVLDKIPRQLEDSEYFKSRRRPRGQLVEIGSASRQADQHWKKEFKILFEEED